MVLIVSASRSPPGQGPKSEKAFLLEFFFAILEIFGIFFGSIFDHWKHFWSVGAYFYCQKVDRASKGVPWGATPAKGVIFLDRFASHFLSFFVFFGYVFKVFFLELQGLFFMDLGSISTFFF